MLTTPRYIVTGGKTPFETPHLEEAMRYYTRLMRKMGNYKVTMVITLAEVSVCGTLPTGISLINQKGSPND